MLISEIIHCTAPSPIVYPEVEFVEHRHASVGVVEHADVGTLATRNDLKHSCAQGGTKLVISDVRLYLDVLAYAADA